MLVYFATERLAYASIFCLWAGGLLYSLRNPAGQPMLLYLASGRFFILHIASGRVAYFTKSDVRPDNLCVYIWHPGG